MSTLYATATDDDVFRAFVDGRELSGDTAKSWVWVQFEDLDAPRETWPLVSYRHTILYSHDVPIAVRSEDCVAFDARPAAVGCRCVGRVMAHVGRAGVFVHEVFDDHEVVTLDHSAFAALCAWLGVT